MVDIHELIWDEWNIAHIARHQVIPKEVEEVCSSDPVIQTGKKGRLLVYGLTYAGRMVTVVLDPEPEEGMYYPVTARPTAKKERKIYEQEKEIEQHGKKK